MTKARITKGPNFSEGHDPANQVNHGEVFIDNATARWTAGKDGKTSTIELVNRHVLPYRVLP